jgi:hypothetical protein
VDIVSFFIVRTCGVDDSKCKAMCVVHGEDVKNFF